MSMKKIAFVLTLLFVFIFVNNVYTLAYEPPQPPHSDAVLLVYLDKEITVFEKNADKKLFPASLSKIMTAIIALENTEDLDEIKITAKASVLNLLEGTDSSHADIAEGEILTMRQLLYCLIVQSANDAAVIIADYIGNGDINNFIQMMNDKAKELGCANTNFVNPHGLHDADHYSTARDIYKMTQYAMDLPSFAEMSAETRYTIPETNKNEERTLVTTNYLLDKVNGGDYYYSPAIGIKTGFTDQAGRCLVSAATLDGYNYMLITMGAFETEDDNENYAFVDSINLYEWVFGTLKLKPITDDKTPVGEVKVELSITDEFVKVAPKNNFVTLIPEQIDASTIIIEPILPDSVEAPVTLGQTLGVGKLYLGEQYLGEVDLVACSSIEQSKLLAFFKSFNDIIASSTARTIIFILIAVIVFYVIIIIIINRRKKKFKKVKEFKKF